MRGIEKSPIACNLLHFKATVRPRIWCDHIHSQAQSGFKKALIPFGRNVADSQRIAAILKRARQNILIVVKHSAIFNRRRICKIIGIFQNQLRMFFERVARPEIKRVNTQTLAQSVSGKSRPACICTDQPDGILACDNPVSFPMPAQFSLCNFFGNIAIS